MHIVINYTLLYATKVINLTLRASLKYGARRLARPDTANNYARQPAPINRLVYMSLYSYAKVSSLPYAPYAARLKNCLIALYVIQRLAIADFVSFPAPPFSGLLVKSELVTTVAY